MATLSGGVLSGSTNGRGIKLAATATPGTTLHTVGAGTAGFDEVWIWLTNTDSVARTVTIEWGGTTNPDDQICDTLELPAQSGPTLVVPGIRLNNGLVIKAFASVTNVVVAFGQFNRVA